MVLSAALMVTACGEDDDFTESIFDTSISAVDQSAATAPFDQWLYDNFVVPYNTEIQYKFNFTASDLGYQLAPADYKKSQLLSHFIKYLFYEVYDKYGEKDQNGNAVVCGNALTYDSHNNLVLVSEDKNVILEGLDGYIVAAGADTLMICRRKSEDMVFRFSSDIELKKLIDKK